MDKETREQIALLVASHIQVPQRPKRKIMVVKSCYQVADEIIKLLENHSLPEGLELDKDLYELISNARGKRQTSEEITKLVQAYFLSRQQEAVEAVIEQTVMTYTQANERAIEEATNPLKADITALEQSLSEAKEAVEEAKRQTAEEIWEAFSPIIDRELGEDCPVTIPGIKTRLKVKGFLVFISTEKSEALKQKYLG